MKIQSNDFSKIAKRAINDPDLQAAVSFGTNVGYTKRKAAMFDESLEHGEAMRKQAASIKRRALNQLPDLLEQAEANMQAKGIKVLWASNDTEANQHVLEIAKKHQVKLAVKSKSMVTEETGLNHALEDEKIEVIETDLGEFIVQLGEETPSHIVVPIIHKTKSSIRNVLIEKANMPPLDDTEEMTDFCRQHLRQKFLNADMGISGGNFIIAETGSLCLVTNEGNGRMVTSLPKVHVALVGIEKVIATVEDYATLTQVLPRSATGQTLTVYTNIINGPRYANEPDGPEHVYVIFLDNGRSKIYASGYTESLACIRCGACLNACPVYQSTGGHAYGWVYPGPIGAIVTPLLKGLENSTPLPNASSLCGMCKEVCPVDIDIPRMLLDLRHDLTEQNRSPKIWGLGINIWAKINKSPHLYKLSGKVAALFSKLLPLKNLPGPLAGWTKHRTLPVLAKKSFRELWQEHHNEKAENND